MGKITIRETSSVDNGTSTSHSEVEYIFESSEDFFYWSEQKQEAMNAAVKSFVGGLSDASDYATTNFDEPSADNVTEIKVGKKKDKLH